MIKPRASPPSLQGTELSPGDMSEDRTPGRREKGSRYLSCRTQKGVEVTGSMPGPAPGASSLSAQGTGGRGKVAASPLE